MTPEALGVRTRRGERGVTLIEMVVATVAFMGVLASVFGALSTGTRSIQTTTIPNQLDRQAHRVAERVAKVLRGAGNATLLPAPTPPLGASIVTFRRSLGAAGGVANWSPTISLGLEDDPTDPVDGIDNDNDGSVDEGMLVWRRDVGGPNEVAEIWIRGVTRLAPGELNDDTDNNGNGLIDEAGFSLAAENGSIVIRLSIQRRGLDGRLITSSVERAVRLRN